MPQWHEGGASDLSTVIVKLKRPVWSLENHLTQRNRDREPVSLQLSQPLSATPTEGVNSQRRSAATTQRRSWCKQGSPDRVAELLLF